MNNNKFSIELINLLPKDIDDINNFIKKNPNGELLIKFVNTRGLSSSGLIKIIDSPKLSIRVAGGFDREREERTCNVQFYENKNIYTRNELIQILRCFELIEKGLEFKEYSEFEKAYYIYNKLKRYIVYDRRIRIKDKDMDSLRGITYRRASSYGFSMIFKEMMDRQNIKCHFVEGNNMRYAWNILEIGGNNYCVDLTYDSYLFYNGAKSDCYFFGVYDKERFDKRHKPISSELITNYKENIKIIENIHLVNIDRFFKSSNNTIKALKYVRNNKTSFLIAGLDIIKNFKNPLYKYLYCDYGVNGRMSNPRIILSEVNFFQNIQMRDKLSEHIKNLEGIENKDNSYVKEIEQYKNQYALLKKYDDYIINEFLGTNRLESIPNNYLGYFEYVNDDFIVGFDGEIQSKGNIEVRKYRRDDGSVFIIEKTKYSNGLYYFNYYEFYQNGDQNGGTLNIDVNSFIVDNDITLVDKEFDKFVANVFFYKNRLLKCVNEFGGYMGYCDYKKAKGINKVVNQINNNVVVE